MKKNYNNIIKTLIITMVFLGINHLTVMYLNNKILQIGMTIMLSIALTLLMENIQKKGVSGIIMENLSNINSLDFKLPSNINISDENKEIIRNIARQIKTNLKTQVEISTEIYNECERLNLLSRESLSSSELIASSVEIADRNTMEQGDMLNETNELANQINNSMEVIARDMVDKIEFISSSITSAQRGIETIGNIETRINNSKDMTEETSKRVLNLESYSNEVGSLVELINAISGETKMLSLNASIEAARAGEEGRGFAIVAAEVGKLAGETENVSRKIENVINTLRNEIGSAAELIKNDMEYMDENCTVIGETNKDLRSVVDSLNLGKESLEEIKEVTEENSKMIQGITVNIHKMTSFSEETTSQMIETSNQTADQYHRAKSLDEAIDKIKDNVHGMQQFVVGKAMEERMLKQVYIIKDFFVKNKNVTDNQIKELIKEVGVDAVYITNPEGVVEYSNEKSGIGLNLYIADPSFLEFKKSKPEYIVTPIKRRMEDNKLFKFLTVTDEAGSLYEIGLGLDSLIKDV